MNYIKIIAQTVAWFSLVGSLLTFGIFWLLPELRVKARLLLAAVALADFLFTFSIIFLTYNNENTAVCHAQNAVIVFATLIGNLSTCVLPSYIAAIIWFPLSNKKKRRLNVFLVTACTLVVLTAVAMMTAMLAFETTPAITESGWCFISTVNTGKLDYTGTTLQFVFYYFPVAICVGYMLLMYPLLKCKVGNMDLSASLRILNQMQFIGIALVFVYAPGLTVRTMQYFGTPVPEGMLVWKAVASPMRGTINFLFFFFSVHTKVAYHFQQSRLAQRMCCGAKEIESDAEKAAAIDFDPGA